jgi:hypothetical protein
VRGDSHPDAVAYYRQLEKEFKKLGLRIELTNPELFLVRGPENSKKQEAFNARSLQELEAYLRGVEAVMDGRVPAASKGRKPR